MPILVHVADKKNERRIQSSGLRVGKHSPGVYLMPVVDSHLVSHQWVRELKRSGIRNFIGVYVRLSATEPVWAGKYNAEHLQVSLGEALQELRSLDDPLGYELFVTRPLESSEIHRIRDISPKTGWRYYPGAHGKTPCGCPACLAAGEFKSKPIRDRYEENNYKGPTLAESRQSILDAEDDEDLIDAFWGFPSNRRWKLDPSFLAPTVDSDNDEVAEFAAIVLGRFRHPATRALLLQLCAHRSAVVREAATESLCDIHGSSTPAMLGALAEDPTVQLVLEDKGHA